MDKTDEFVKQMESDLKLLRNFKRRGIGETSDNCIDNCINVLKERKNVLRRYYRENMKKLNRLIERFEKEKNGGKNDGREV
jgi:hypothetical protein